ncbi:MAG: c-type cytochrome, partial [Ferruginibacter sp.]
WNDSAANSHKETWFRPCDVAIGTDGAIYVADWYDPVVGGHQMQDKKGYGRIYRITPKNKKLQSPRLDLGNIAGQVGALKNPAINVRHLAFNLLKKQADSAVDQVSALLKDDNPYVQARAIWLLPQLGAKGVAATEQLLKSPDENIRAIAFRALRVSVTGILPYAARLQNDPSPFVRREIAIALRDLPFQQTREVLLHLVGQYDGEDRWYLETIGAALSGHEQEIYPEIKQLLAAGKTPVQWDKRMATIAWRLHPLAALDDLIVRASDQTLDTKDRRVAITAIGFMNDKKAAQEMLALSQGKLADVREQASYWLSFRQGNDWFNLLDWKKINFNTGYERKLAGMKAKLKGVLDENISTEARKSRLEEMARDSVGGQLLIGLAAENKFPKPLIGFMEEAIFSNPDITVRVQAGKYFKQPGGQKNYSIPVIAALTSNETKGKIVFTTYCASCHKVGQAGNNIGPELTAIGKKFDKTALLDAIINPSGAVMAEYQPWLINTKDGGSFFGFLVSENKSSLTLKDATGKTHLVAIDKISSRQKQTRSLMPEPGLRGLTEQQLADVVRYLQGGG